MSLSATKEEEGRRKMASDDVNLKELKNRIESSVTMLETLFPLMQGIQTVALQLERRLGRLEEGTEAMHKDMVHSLDKSNDKIGGLSKKVAIVERGNTLIVEKMSRLLRINCHGNSSMTEDIKTLNNVTNTNTSELKKTFRRQTESLSEENQSLSAQISSLQDVAETQLPQVDQVMLKEEIMDNFETIKDIAKGLHATPTTASTVTSMTSAVKSGFIFRKPAIITSKSLFSKVAAKTDPVCCTSSPATSAPVPKHCANPGSLYSGLVSDPSTVTTAVVSAFDSLDKSNYEKVSSLVKREEIAETPLEITETPLILSSTNIRRPKQDSLFEVTATPTTASAVTSASSMTSASTVTSMTSTVASASTVKSVFIFGKPAIITPPATAVTAKPAATLATGVTAKPDATAQPASLASFSSGMLDTATGASKPFSGFCLPDPSSTTEPEVKPNTSPVTAAVVPTSESPGGEDDGEGESDCYNSTEEESEDEDVERVAQVNDPPKDYNSGRRWRSRYQGRDGWNRLTSGWNRPCGSNGWNSWNRPSGGGDVWNGPSCPPVTPYTGHKYGEAYDSAYGQCEYGYRPGGLSDYGCYAPRPGEYDDYGFGDGEPVTIETETIYVKSSDVGRIIGRGGSRIQEMQEESGCTIKIPPCGVGILNHVELSGLLAEISDAKQRISDIGVEIHSSIYGREDHGWGW